MTSKSIKFKIGDVVRLKSGGVDFTVQSMEKNKVSVRWSENDRIKSDVFEGQMLEHSRQQNMDDLEIARRIAFALEVGARRHPKFSSDKHSSLDAKLRLLKGRKTKRL